MASSRRAHRQNAPGRSPACARDRAATASDRCSENRASVSTSTGVAPAYRIEATVADERVRGGDHLVARASMPSASSIRCSAAVHDETATACFAPTYAANFSSNRWVFGPIVSHPDRSVSTTSAISSSPMTGCGTAGTSADASRHTASLPSIGQVGEAGTAGIANHDGYLAGSRRPHRPARNSSLPRCALIASNPARQAAIPEAGCDDVSVDQISKLFEVALTIPNSFDLGAAGCSEPRAQGRSSQRRSKASANATASRSGTSRPLWSRQSARECRRSSWPRPAFRQPSLPRARWE